MRIMAVDYGDARTGVAVSDVSAALVGDAWVVRQAGRDKLAGLIAAEARSREAGVVVVGYPKNMDGSIGPRAEKSDQFAALLREKLAEQEQAEQGDGSSVPPITVVLWDERLTTMSADRILAEAGKFGKKRKNTIDAVAASLILESYLRK